MSNRTLGFAVLLLFVTAACGGSSSSPTGPAAAGGSTGGASISGTMQSGGSSSLTSAITSSAIAGTTVTVVGTTISAVVDGSGKFTLRDVPAGNVLLQFGGPVSGTVSVTQVHSGDTITLVLKASSTSVTVESETRNGVSHDLNVNGVIDSLTGTAAAFEFKIGSQLVKGDASTQFFGDGDSPDTFDDLDNGERVEVKGLQRDGHVYAVRIHINDGDDDDDDDDDEQDSSASIHGKLTAKSGTAPALTLTVGGTTVMTTSDTEVKRRGDVQSLSTLQIGMDLHVIGVRQADGSIIARRIEINDDATGGEFEIEGSAGGVSGTCPAITFGVNGYNIKTTSATTFEDITCANIKSGTKVNVKGIVGADNVVTATRVKKK